MTVEQLAYLKCPDKIRAALINMGGPRLSIDEVKARLPQNEYVRGGNIPDYVEPEPVKPKGLRLTPEERAKIAAIAAGIPNRVTPIDTSKLAEPKTLGKDLVRLVLREMNIPTGEFFGGTRCGHVRAAGALVAVVLRQVDPELYSYPQIARIVGRRDHTTIIHAVRRWPDFAEQYPEYKALYERIMAGLAA